MSSNKKYGGTIIRWYKQDVTGYMSKAELNRAYGKNLGFIVRGFLPEDPTGRGFGGYPLQTSLVVKINKAQTQIETLNTIYDLREPRVNES